MDAEEYRLRGAFRKRYPNVNEPTWDQYRIFLVSEMDRLGGTIEHLTARLDSIEKLLARQGAVSQQNAKWVGALWGGLAGFGAVLANILWDLFFRSKR